MQIEISDQPIQFLLHGFSGVVEDNRFGEVGFRLMNEMWQVVKSANILTTGINHWVYLPDGKMFVGVELQGTPSSAILLEPLEFQMKRYLKHVHMLVLFSVVCRKIYSKVDTRFFGLISGIEPSKWLLIRPYQINLATFEVKIAGYGMAIIALKPMKKTTLTEAKSDTIRWLQSLFAPTAKPIPAPEVSAAPAPKG